MSRPCDLSSVVNEWVPASSCLVLAFAPAGMPYWDGANAPDMLKKGVSAAAPSIEHQIAPAAGYLLMSFSNSFPVTCQKNIITGCPSPATPQHFGLFLLFFRCFIGRRWYKSFLHNCTEGHGVSSESKDVKRIQRNPCNAEHLLWRLQRLRLFKQFDSQRIQ